MFEEKANVAMYIIPFHCDRSKLGSQPAQCPLIRSIPLCSLPSRSTCPCFRATLYLSARWRNGVTSVASVENSGKGDCLAETVIVEGARKRLETLIDAAIDCLADVMANPSRHSIARLNAARAILDRAGLPAIAATELSGRGGEPLEIIVRSVLTPLPGSINVPAVRFTGPPAALPAPAQGIDAPSEAGAVASASTDRTP